VPLYGDRPRRRGRKFVESLSRDGDYVTLKIRCTRCAAQQDFFGHGRFGEQTARGFASDWEAEHDAAAHP
jgi:hypothetical protein